MNRKHQLHLSSVAVCLSTLTVVTCAIFIYPIEQQVFQGENATLYCQFNSTEQCLWQLQTGAIINKSLKDYEIFHDTESGICSLTITNVNIERHEGDFKCLILMSHNHPAGLVSNISSVRVIVPPSAPYMLYNGNRLKNNSEIPMKSPTGGLRRFVCETSHGSPASSISWQLGPNEIYSKNVTVSDEIDGSKLKRTTSVLDLHLDFIMDGKILMCIAEHVGNKTEKVFVKLNVAYTTNRVKILSGHLVTVEEGEDISFRCEANGNPPPKYEWRFKAANKNEWTKISTLASFREIADEKKQGKYLCLAGNKEPLLWSSEMTVEVTEKPMVQFAAIPGMFCGISVVILFTIILVTGLKQLQKKRYLEANKIQGQIDSVPSKVCGVSVVPSAKSHSFKKSENIPQKNNHRSSRSSISTDSDGYMIARRPLPPIEEVDNDQYMEYDPDIDNKFQKPSPGNNRPVNLYEDPHDYENTVPIRISISTIC